jgi:hypothetical protein
MAVGVNIVSTFDSKGISRAIKDFQKIEGAGNKATFGLRTFDKGMTNTLKTVGKLAAGVAVAAGAIGFKLASAAYESQKVMAQTEAIIKATGGAAGITAGQVSKLSETLSMQIGVDDELIQTSANLLLTFKQIQNQVGENNNIFDRAVIAAQDLGSVFGSADAAALQLGKALSNPVKGITALTRSGINFTDQQKEQIKTLVASGDVLGAQKIILAEIEAQVGGTAAATATGFDRMRIAIGNVAEEFGAILIPYIEKFANYVVQKVVPYLSNLADVIGEKGLGAGLKILADDLLTATTNMGTFGNVVLGLTAAFVALRLIAIAATISVNLFTVSLLSNPIGIVVAAVIALGVALVALYLKFEGVRTVINAIGLVLKTTFMNIIELIYNAFAMLYNGFAQGINLLIKGANLFGANIPEIEMMGYKAFTVIGNAAETAGKKIGASKKSIDTYGSRLDALAASFKGATGGGGGGGGGGFGGGMAKAVETAQEKLQKYIDALKGMSSAQKAARDADKSLMKSRTSLAEATTKLTDAQAYFNQVVAGYGANSKQAKDRQLALRKAQGAVERAGYDVESSVFAVTKAEQELAAVRLDPESSAQTIREAEIALAESKLSVKDATDAQVEATDALTEAETLLDETINGAKEGSDAYTEALDRLNDAKKSQVDATDAVTEAIERQTEATDRLREAEEKAQAARVGVKAGDAAAAETKVGVAPPPVSTAGGFGSFMEAVRGLHPNSQALKSGTPVTDARKQFPKLYAEYKAKGLAMAQGGIITKPTQLLAGEAGAEAIIPLDKLQSGMTVNVTINAGMGTDPAKLGDEIVDVLTRYQRRNGALPLKVA